LTFHSADAAGTLGQAPRTFVAGALGESCTQVDVALLLASELVANSVEHSGCGGRHSDRGGRVEVTDRGGGGVLVLPPAADHGEAEGGRGMRLVDALSARWGCHRGGGVATTWFELALG
jgi:hypothetical protein